MHLAKTHATRRDTCGMRAFFAWVLTAMVSIGLGLALYTTSLAGSTTGYQEAPFTPGPTSTVVKTKTKIVRTPGKTRVVYVPQTVAPAPVVAQPQYTAASGSSGGSVSRHDSTDSDD